MLPIFLGGPLNCTGQCTQIYYYLSNCYGNVHIAMYFLLVSKKKYFKFSKKNYVKLWIFSDTHIFNIFFIDLHFQQYVDIHKSFQCLCIIKFTTLEPWTFGLTFL